ncbi:MAG TPA: ThiF family adenylyltransferase [Gemmatimonadaceae bacterium]|nr:ThiF family adenylyltransferase [Gemmatimonadaceae bacterium]
MSDAIFAELNRAARLPVETAGVLLASVVSTKSGPRLLGRRLLWVNEDAYARREADGLSIRSSGYVHALGEAANMQAAAVWLHTHPGVGSRPVPSRHDHDVDSELIDVFRLRTGSPYYVSMVIAPTSDTLSFTGSIWSSDDTRWALDRIQVVGDRLQALSSFERHQRSEHAMFDRNIRAFGPAMQATLDELRVGIIGCGGTGSSVAEQLARLGVRQFTLVDPDELTASNVTRLYGSTLAQVGAPKVEVVGAHLRDINPSVQVDQLRSSICVQSTAESLTDCDVLFGCTDDNAGRLVLSRLATYMMLPVIDCGVLLSADAHSRVAGIDGRVTTLVPGQACLVCRGRINLRRAASELLTPDERKRRAEEGYAPALGGVEPAVVSFTTAVAAAAICELLERLIGYGPSPRPSEVLLRMHEREISTNRAEPRIGHYCHEAAGKVGLGITTPFLEQTWSQ